MLFYAYLWIWSTNPYLLLNVQTQRVDVLSQLTWTCLLEVFKNSAALFEEALSAYLLGFR